MIRPNPNPADYLKRLAAQGLRGADPPSGPNIVEINTADLPWYLPPEVYLKQRTEITQDPPPNPHRRSRVETVKTLDRAIQNNPNASRPITNSGPIPAELSNPPYRDPFIGVPQEQGPPSATIPQYPRGASLRNLASKRLNKGRMTAV